MLDADGGYKCPAYAPVPRRYQIRGGGTTVLCTTADGGLETATPPLALGHKDAVPFAEMAMPEGYRKAWKDGRLNPNRGKGTAIGQAQQDQVWTQDTPAQLVANAPAAQIQAKQKTYTTAASNAPRAPKAKLGGYYIQVGTFGEAANAKRTSARLQAMGLPVANSRITHKGRALQIVMAGPFVDTGSAQAALTKARRSGFGDAFIR